MTNDVPIPSSNDRSRNIVQGMGSLTAQNLATALLGLVFQIALIRLLSPTQYGVYSGLVVAIGIASMAAMLGLNQTVARYLAFLQREDEAKSWVAARKILYLTLVFTIVATAIYSMVTPELSLYFSKTTHWTGAFLLGGLWLFLTPLTGVSQGIVQGMRQYTLLAKMLFLSKVAMVVIGASVVFFYRNIDVAIIAWVVYSVIIVAWTIGLAGRKLWNSKGELEYHEILKYTYPLGIAATISIIATSADLVVVAGYLNPVSLGVYNVAVTISTVLTSVFVYPLMTALLPELSSLAGEKEISNGMRLAFRFLLLAVLPGSLLIASVSKQLIDLFSRGGVYLNGSPSLELIAFFYLFYGIQVILTVMFQATGKTIHAMIVGLAGALSDIGISIILVPSLGLLGAATGKVSVGIVGALVGIYLGRRYLGSLGNISFYGKCLVSAIIPFATTLSLSSYVSIRVMTLVPYTVIFGIVFLVCVKLFGLLSPEDKSFVSHLMPKFMNRIIGYL